MGDFIWTCPSDSHLNSSSCKNIILRGLKILGWRLATKAASPGPRIEIPGIKKLVMRKNSKALKITEIHIGKLEGWENLEKNKDNAWQINKAVWNATPASEEEISSPPKHKVNWKRTSSHREKKWTDALALRKLHGHHEIQTQIYSESDTIHEVS